MYMNTIVEVFLVGCLVLVLLANSSMLSSFSNSLIGKFILVALVVLAALHNKVSGLIAVLIFVSKTLLSPRSVFITIGFSISETYIHVSELSLPTSSKKRPGWTFNVQLYEHDKKIPINLKSEFHKEQFDLFKDKKTGYYIILYG